MGQSHEYEWEDGQLVQRADRRDTLPAPLTPVENDDTRLQRLLFCREAAIRIRTTRTVSHEECWREARRLWEVKPDDL